MNQEVEELKEKGNEKYSLALKSINNNKLYHSLLKESLDFYSKGLEIDSNNYILYSIFKLKKAIEV